MSGVERRLNELRTIAKKFAKAEAQRVYLDEFKKSKLAMLMNAAELQGVEAVNAQEREARRHPEYLELLAGLKAAIEESEALRWELQIARMGASLWQTEQANQRVEVKAYGS